MHSNCWSSEAKSLERTLRLEFRSVLTDCPAVDPALCRFASPPAAAGRMGRGTAQGRGADLAPARKTTLVGSGNPATPFGTPAAGVGGMTACGHRPANHRGLTDGPDNRPGSPDGARPRALGHLTQPLPTRGEEAASNRPPLSFNSRADHALQSLPSRANTPANSPEIDAFPRGTAGPCDRPAAGSSPARTLPPSLHASSPDPRRSSIGQSQSDSSRPEETA